jgi:hypothetical protein
MPRISAPYGDITPNPDAAQVSSFSQGGRPLNHLVFGLDMFVLAINLTFLFFARTIQKINMCFFAPIDYGGAI